MNDAVIRSIHRNYDELMELIKRCEGCSELLSVTQVTSIDVYERFEVSRLDSPYSNHNGYTFHSTTRDKQARTITRCVHCDWILEGEQLDAFEKLLEMRYNR